MSIFDKDIYKNTDDIIKANFAFSCIKTPVYCIQAKYYGNCCEGLIARTEEASKIFGAGLLKNLELVICEYYQVITNKIIDEWWLEILEHRIESYLEKQNNIIKYNGMMFYPDTFKVNKDIASMIHSYLLCDPKMRGMRLTPFVKIIKYIRGEPIHSYTYTKEHISIW